MLVIDEDEARVVRMMFDLCISSGYGRWRLANFLNDHGIKNRKGQNWHDASVGGILHNPLYKGSFGAEKPMPVPLRPSRSSPQTNSTWRRN